MRNSYFSIASRNLQTAKRLLDAGDYNESVRYCQQYVEKSLKGYIEINGGIEDLKLMTIHSPIPLYKRFCELSSESGSGEDRRWMSVLKTYYYDTNYPGENFIEVEEEDAKTCYQYVLAFREQYGRYFIDASAYDS